MENFIFCAVSSKKLNCLSTMNQVENAKGSSPNFAFNIKQI